MLHFVVPESSRSLLHEAFCLIPTAALENLVSCNGSNLFSSINMYAFILLIGNTANENTGWLFFYWLVLDPTFSLSIDAYFPLINCTVLVTLLHLAWYKIVMQCSVEVYLGVS